MSSKQNLLYHNRKILILLTLLALIAAPASPMAATTDITSLSLEQLMQIEVTSAAKKPQKLSQTATAMYVITSEDIRRSGVTSIPEALRMAPGVQVAHIDHNKWSVSIRGFSSLFCDDLLVLMDGRTVYNSLFSGVFWDVQDTLLEDVERIEIIRGPGASLWGANAVNGVINIITKSSQDTKGTLLTTGAGSEDKIISGLRYGDSLGDLGTYRVYAKHTDRNEFVDARGHKAWDDSDMLRAGFRADLNPADRHRFTIQGDIYDATSGTRVTMPTVAPPYTTQMDTDMEMDGGNLLARYQHQFSNGSNFTLQAYYDRADRKLFFGKLERETIDLDLQHRFSWGKRQEIIWGLGYRHIDHEVSVTTEMLSFGDRRMDLFSGFLQDEITLIPERLALIIGSKCEHNDFTGFEIQPNARLLWTPNQTTTLWAAVSRAVRTPSRANHDITMLMAVIPPNPLNPLPTKVVFTGDDSFDSEELLAWEAGYRTQLRDNLNIDLALFYNQYDDIEGDAPGTTSVTFPTVTMTIKPENTYDVTIYGAELLIDWQPFAWWRLQFAGSCMDMDSDPDSERDQESPEYQLSLRSLVDLPHNLEFDLWLRTMDELPTPDIPSYTQLDLRLGWQPLEYLELSLSGQNLLDPRQPEYAENLFVFDNSEVERSFYLKATLEF